MRWMKLGLLIVVAFGVAAWGQKEPKYPLPLPSGPVDLSKEAVVLFSTFEGSSSSTKRSMVKVFIQKEGTPLNQFYIYSKKMGDRPAIERFEPGRYFFAAVADDLVAWPQEPLPIEPFDPETNIPLTPFEVKAGEVVYLGNILIAGLGRNMVTGRARGVTYEIIDRSEDARKALEKYVPEAAPSMETRLIEVLP